MAALCVCDAQEEGTGVTASKSAEELYNMRVREVEAKLSASHSVEERYKILDEYYKMLPEGLRAIQAASRSLEEQNQVLDEYIKARLALREPFIEVLCKMLETKFDDPNPEYVNEAMSRFYNFDGHNIASYGNPEALDWARRVMKEKPAEQGFDRRSARDYLVVKGDGRDLDLISSREWRERLNMRVAGTNLINFFRPANTTGGASWYSCLPSVTNTGPQGLYVQEILRQFWETIEIEVDDSVYPTYRFRDISKIPEELLTMVVWFDENGNPVCNVDLAKYDLTMPELDVPNRPKGKPNAAAAPPPPPEKPVTATRAKTPPIAIAEDEPSEAAHTHHRPWLYTVILSTLCIGVALWLIRKKR